MDSRERPLSLDKDGDRVSLRNSIPRVLFYFPFQYPVNTLNVFSDVPECFPSGTEMSLILNKLYEARIGTKKL
jgi:hypothetical protein